MLRTNIALQTENSQIARVRAYASEVLGARGEASDTGLARSGTSRFGCDSVGVFVVRVGVGGVIGGLGGILGGGGGVSNIVRDVDGCRC